MNDAIRIPLDSWLAVGHERRVHGSYLAGRAYVVLTERGREVAEGHGATLIEAFADACNDLMRRAA